MRWIPPHPFKGDDPGGYAITWILAALFLAWPYFAAGGHGNGAAWAEAGWVVFLLACWLVIVPFARGLLTRPPRAELAAKVGRSRGELSMDDLAARVAASAADPKIARTGAYEGPPSDIGEADVDVACRYVTDHLDGNPELIDVEYLGEVDGKPTYHVTYEYDDPGAPEPAPSRLDAAKIARLRARRTARTTPPPRT